MTISSPSITTFVRNLTRQSASNFYYAFLFLPKEKREAIYTVYAFCRVSDDLVDEEAGPKGAGSGALENLEEWRTELLRCYEGQPTHPITQKLATLLPRFPIPQKHFTDLLDGIAMDLCPRRYETYADLTEYSHRVASTVGLICLSIFEVTGEKAREYAVELGLAFQLTNILRDLRSDAQRGRVYLPREDLRRFGYSERELSASRYTPAFAALMRFEVERVRDHLRRAEAALTALPHPRPLLAAEIMRAIYTALLTRIEAVRYDVFGHRITLPRRRKLTLALRTCLRLLAHP